MKTIINKGKYIFTSGSQTFVPGNEVSVVDDAAIRLCQNYPNKEANFYFVETGSKQKEEKTEKPKVQTTSKQKKWARRS